VINLKSLICSTDNLLTKKNINYKFYENFGFAFFECSRINFLNSLELLSKKFPQSVTIKIYGINENRLIWSSKYECAEFEKVLIDVLVNEQKKNKFDYCFIIYESFLL